MLDVNLEVVGGKIEHEFFKKPCTSEVVILTPLENEDGRPGGGGIEEPYQRAGVGEEQEGDGGLEQKVKEEWLPSHHEARGD